jgi:membrane-bound metal-dependent hydrolase YbcI (DUF457 family)
MPLPLAHGLIGASIVAITLPEASPVKNWKPLLLGAALSIAPDFDFFLATSWHRGFTHSLIFAAVISLICFLAAGLANIRLAVGCAGAIFSHGLLDFATTKAMPGVELLWPFSTRRFGLGLIDYYQLTGIDPVYFLSHGVLSDLLKMGIIELIIFAPIFLFVLSVKWSINKHSRV